MGDITTDAATEFRDFEAPGSSELHDPGKPGIRALFGKIDVTISSAVNGLVIGNAVVYATRAGLYADLAHIANTLGVVYADSTAAYNGVYVKVGGSGSGSWTLTSITLPSSFVDDLNAAIADLAALVDNTPMMGTSDDGEAYLQDATGMATALSSDVFMLPSGKMMGGTEFYFGVQESDSQEIIVSDAETGLGAVYGSGSGDISDGGASAGALWTDAQYAYVQGRAETEALRIGTQDVSGYQKLVAGCNLMIGTGQSFMAGSDNARLFLSASRIALLAATTWPGVDDRPVYSVGPDTRCVDSGAVYVPYNSGSLTFTQARENFTLGTGIDTIVSSGDVLIGDYPSNSRGGTPEIVRDVLAWVLRNRWNLRADTDVTAGEDAIPMNHAKTDGTVIEVTTGDGLARFYSLIEVFNDAVTNNRGGGEARRCALVDINHGEADMQVSPASAYQSAWELARTNIIAKLTSEISQSSPPMFLMQQAGGPRYGGLDMYSSNAMVDMMLDITGTSAGFHLVGCKYEVPNFYFVDESTGHPNFGDGHPTLAGNVLMGIRSAVGFHYIHDREENYWVPFPYECYFTGNRFVIAIPCKFPPLREVGMVCGTEVEMLASLGITFETTGGSANPVSYARTVPGYGMLIEGECDDDITGFEVMKTGKRTGTLSQSGFTNIRDSFYLDLPFALPFDQQQTIYATEYHDDPIVNELGRYLEAIPGWVGKPDLGNPVACRTITAQPMPSL